MALRRLGIIGAGGIADLALSTLADGLTAPLTQVSILVPGQFEEQAQALLDRLGDKLAVKRVVRTELAALLADKPDVVAECASHTAVDNFGPAILESGCDLIVISIGSLSDDALRAKLEQAARKGSSRILLPSGAIGGVDALAAARLSGLEQVIYTGRKPPKAWRNTPAEKLLDLETLKEPTVFFEGSARTAAHDYPFNANVASALRKRKFGWLPIPVSQPTSTNSPCGPAAATSPCGWRASPPPRIRRPHKWPATALRANCSTAPARL